MNRRGFLSGIIAAAVAPAIIRTPGPIMPIMPIKPLRIVSGLGPPLSNEDIFAMIPVPDYYKGIIAAMRENHNRALNIILKGMAEDIFNTGSGGPLLASNA